MNIPKTKAQYRKELIRRAKAGLFPSYSSRAKVGGGGACKYRQNSRKTCERACVVGILIPDEKYSPKIEFQSLWTDPIGEITDAQQFQLRGAIVLPKGVTLRQLRGLQLAHDDEGKREKAGKWSPKATKEFIAQVKEILQ